MSTAELGKDVSKGDLGDKSAIFPRGAVLKDEHFGPLRQAALSQAELEHELNPPV